MEMYSADLVTLRRMSLCLVIFMVGKDFIFKIFAAALSKIFFLFAYCKRWLEAIYKPSIGSP